MDILNIVADNILLLMAACASLFGQRTIALWVKTHKAQYSAQEVLFETLLVASCTFALGMVLWTIIAGIAVAV